MVKAGDLIRLHEEAVAFVKEVRVIERTHDGAEGHFLVLKTVQQDNPNGFCVYNASLTVEGDLWASELIYGNTKYGTIDSLTV